jgi:hypothetical protein
MNGQSLGLFAAACVFAVALPHEAGAAGAASPPMQKLRGTIVAATATSLIIKTSGGPVTVRLGPKATVVGATPGSIADITPGKFLGIGSVPGNGPNRALEVSVFADSMRGMGEGDYPWDPGTAAHHSMMTNGTVAGPSGHAMMTNATVGAMHGSGDKTITMKYKGGSRTLIIPSGTPVIRVAPGTRALLAAGDPAFVAATAGSAPSALFVVVGRRGMNLPL